MTATDPVRLATWYNESFPASRSEVGVGMISSNKLRDDWVRGLSSPRNDFIGLGFEVDGAGKELELESVGIVS